MLCYGCNAKWYENYNPTNHHLKIKGANINQMIDSCQPLIDGFANFKNLIRESAIKMSDVVLSKVGGITMKIEDFLMIEEWDTIDKISDKL